MTDNTQANSFIRKLQWVFDWCLAVFLAVCALAMFFTPMWYFGLFLLGLAGYLSPALQTHIPEKMLQKKYKVSALVFISSFLLCSIVMLTHQDRILQAAEEERRIAFSENKDAIIKSIQDLIKEEKYSLATLEVQKHISLNDPDIRELKRTIDQEQSKIKAQQRIAYLKEDFTTQRESLMQKMETDLSNQETFASVHSASAYLEIADEEFIALHDKVNAAKQLAEKAATAKPYIERIERELESFKKGEMTIPNNIEGFKITLAIFAVHAQNVEEAKNYDLTPQDKKTVERYKQAVIARQKKAFPKLRDAYGPVARNLVWEYDISASTFGNKFQTIEYVGGMFAANRNIKAFANEMHETMTLYRFKRIRFKWFKEASEYTYYDLDTPDDGDLVVFDGNRPRVIK